MEKNMSSIAFDSIADSKRYRMSYTRVIALGFLIIIVCGAAILSLPVSSKSGEWTSYFDCLFTATSATCVTGLVVYDTYSQWSVFGQIVILLMIQTGGIGFMTIITVVSIFMGRRISLYERKLIMQSAGNTKLSGMIQLVKRIVLGTMLFEIAGAVLLSTSFCPRFGLLRGIYYSIFHSVSAFCNAGFDLMGIIEPYSSLTHFQSDPVVNITISSLILIGGLGFMVWNNLLTARLNYKKYLLHTKIVLVGTLVMVVVPTVLFYIFERNGVLSGLAQGDRWLSAYFQAITPRTAGFNTIDLSKLSESGSLLTTVLMLIGGNSGSTAGGMKITTVVVLIFTAFASARHSGQVTVFKRRLSENTLRQASAIATVYITAAVLSTMLICAIEPFDFGTVLFEVSSAIGTVGLTQGITSLLTVPSQAVLILLMYGGRVGGLTLMLALAEKREQAPVLRPREDILIG